MSISIQTVPNDDAARIYILEGNAPTFPAEEYEFTDRNDASRSGYFVVASLLGNSRVAAVKVMRSEMIPGYDKGSWDAVEIRMKEAFVWKASVKAANSNAGAITVEQKFGELLETEFSDGKKKRFQSSSGPSNKEELEIVGVINRHIRNEFAKAASTKEELTRRITKEGYKASAFDTINIDHGNVTAHSFKDGVLTLIFTGNCGSGCVNNSTLATESGLETKLRPIFPFIKQYAFIQQ